MDSRIRVGVVGCGLVAQVMHLPYLRELSDRFEVVAVCDASEELARRCADRYGIDEVFTNADDLLKRPLDAVMVLTSGSHAPIAGAAAAAGVHAFVEKPLCLSVAEGRELLDATDRAGTCLMVGTMKRYDPAYERLLDLVGDLDDLRLVRVTTLDSPFGPYVSHYPLDTGEVPDEVRAAFAADDERRLNAVLPDADDETRFGYRWRLLDDLVHELNMLRGALGDPDRVLHASLTRTCVSINLAFGETQSHLSWVELPGIARYSQELAFYASERRVTLRLPSPYLRSMPSELIVEDGDPNSARSSRTVEVVSYEEAFKRELEEFGDCIRTGRVPRTTGREGLRDVALCAAIARSRVTGRPVDDPIETELAA